MDSKALLQHDDIMEFITRLYDGDLHAKRVLSLLSQQSYRTPLQYVVLIE